MRGSAALVAALGAALLLGALPRDSIGADTAPACNRPLGEQLFELCRTCHSLEVGDAPREGPNLRGVYGAQAATVDRRFQYSPMLRDSGWTWDAATLDRFIANPRRALPGTTMTFIGIRSAEERAALICYLDSAAAR